MRTHPLNVSYLVVGLIFLGLSGFWALREAGVVDLTEAEWLLPLTLVVAGVIGLVALTVKNLAARKSVGSRADEDEPGDFDTSDSYRYEGRDQ
jgi:hypothetical protein